MANRIRFDAFVLQQDNYTTVAAASMETKTPSTPATALLLNNTSASNDAAVSFDGGSHYLTIKAGQSLSVDCDGLISYMVKDAVDGSHATMQCIYAREK